MVASLFRCHLVVVAVLRKRVDRVVVAERDVGVDRAGRRVRAGDRVVEVDEARQRLAGLALRPVERGDQRVRQQRRDGDRVRLDVDDEGQVRAVAGGVRRRVLRRAAELDLQRGQRGERGAGAHHDARGAWTLADAEILAEEGLVDRPDRGRRRREGRRAHRAGELVVEVRRLRRGGDRLRRRELEVTVQHSHRNVPFNLACADSPAEKSVLESVVCWMPGALSCVTCCSC